MYRKLTCSAAVGVLALLFIAPAQSQTKKAPAKLDKAAQLRKSLEEQKQKIEERRAELEAKRAELKAEQRDIANRTRNLRAVNADVARDKAAPQKWICNAYGTEHDDPSECSDPSQGGRWISKASPNLAANQQRAQDLQKSLTDAQQAYAAGLKAFNAENVRFEADAKKLQDDINRAGYGKRPVLLSTDPDAVRDYTSRVAQQAWSRNGAAAADNLASDTELTAELTKAAANSKYLKAADLKLITSIESTGDRDTGVNKFGYAGLFQMGKAAAKDAGYDYSKLDEPSEWKTNVAAGAKFLEVNAERLAKKNLPVTPLNVYLSHQQGSNGAARVLQAVEDGSAATKPANKNLVTNLPASYVNSITRVGKQVTVQNYYDYWTQTFKAVDAAVNSAPLP